MENIAVENNQNSQIAFTQEAPTNETLKGAWQILKDAWNLYHLKFKTALGIMVVPTIISIILNELGIISFSSTTLSQASWFSVIKIIVWAISLYFNVISIAALLFMAKNDLGIKAAYSESLKNSLSYILIVILGLLIITGGFMLVIIPGIIFSVWFSLAIYSFVFEDQKGIRALYRSKQLISGNFWKIVWRLIFVSVVVIIMAMPFAIIGRIIGDSHGFIDKILQLFITPLVIFFEVILFQNLVKLKQGYTFQEPKKIGKFIYYFAAIIAIPLIFGFTLFQGLHFITNDISNPNDSDLQLSAINIPKEQNSFYVFIEAKDKVYWPQEEIDKNGIDDALANKILQNNESSLSSFERGVALSIFQQPELQNPKDYDANLVLESINFMRNLAKVNSLRAQMLFNQGKEKEAFDQSMKTIKMAQMIQDGQNGFIGYLIGLSIKETGLNNLRSLINNSHLSSSELLGYESELNKYKESKLALQKELKGEYIMAMNTKEKMIDPVFRGEQEPEIGVFENISKEQIDMMRIVGGNFYYQPNRTKLEFMNVYRSMIDNAGKRSYSEVNLPQKNIPSGLRLLFTNNVVGKILANIINISLNSVCEKRLEENLSVKETQMLFALKAYKQDTGNLPNSLQNLVPNYISELAQDSFDGKTIKYSSDKKVIYSVGKDLIDNGGNISETDWKQGEDFGFKIDF